MQTESFIPGKDASLESTIATMQAKLAARGFQMDESSWLNPVESIWSVHVRDRECPMLFSNGKGATKLAARASALGEYIGRIQAKVRGNWILPQDLQGNPEAIFLVIQLPTGEVLSTRLLKSSGNPAYDNAVERAILKSSPLPLPSDRSLFDRELKLTFRPRDK